MADDLDLTGKTALVTGSGRNIGRAIVLEFASRGANVVINGRNNAEDATGVQKEALAMGAEAIVVMGDAGKLETVQEMKAAAESAFGRVDIYVCNAATRLSKDFFALDYADWDYYLNQQLSGAFYLAKAFVPAMKEEGWGRIIHINGGDGWHGGWTRIPHSVGKGGLRTLTVSLAKGLGPFGITVNDVAPGFNNVKRPDHMQHAGRPEFIANRVRNIPIRRQTEPEEVAWMCAVLCSQRSAAITGNHIHTDGGNFFASGGIIGLTYPGEEPRPTSAMEMS